MQEKNNNTQAEMTLDDEAIEIVSGGAGENQKIAYYECGLDDCTRKFAYNPDDPESEQAAWHKYCNHLWLHD